MSKTYPINQPYDTGFLKVSNVHTIYYEQVGLKTGKPALYLHGGPGSPLMPNNRQFFDPKVYRAILYNQRGAGKSIPQGCIEENTTWNLVEDIEVLRKHLNIEKWSVVLGVSWGATLALAYASKYAANIRSIVVACVFGLRRSEIDWPYKGIVRFIFPEAWEKLIEPIPNNERSDILHAYSRRVLGNKKEEIEKYSMHLAAWEHSLSNFQFNEKFIQEFFFDEAKFLDPESKKIFQTVARIECHYFTNGGFLEYDEQLVPHRHSATIPPVSSSASTASSASSSSSSASSSASTAQAKNENNTNETKASRSSKSPECYLKGIRGTIIQGRYDCICPMDTAWDLHLFWPGSELIIVPDGVHSPNSPSIREAIIKAIDKYKF